MRAPLGTRTDLNVVKEAIDNGATDKEIADEHFGAWVRYHRAFSEYRSISANPRNWQTELIVFWGPPGSGKTRAATEYDDPRQTWWLPRPAGSTVWWDGYAGERTVIIDEFYGWLRRDTLQRLVDRTPLRVERKGGSVNFTAKTVVITSNVDPEAWWKNVGVGAMQRRLEAPIGACVYVGNDEWPTPESYKSCDTYLELAKKRAEPEPGAYQLGAAQ